MASIVLCHGCGKENAFVERLGRKAECEKCLEDLHCCRNCRFYDPGSYNECRESAAAGVRDKTKGNFCDYFEVGLGTYQEDKSAEVRAAAELLFRKK